MTGACFFTGGYISSQPHTAIYSHGAFFYYGGGSAKIDRFIIDRFDNIKNAYIDGCKF